MTQELDLITTFGKSDGGTHDWKYKGLDPKLSAPEIKEACELLTKLDICTENGVNLFDSVVTAKVVITKETVMFDPEHETKGLTYFGAPAKEASCEEVRCFAVTGEPEISQTKETAGLKPSSIGRIDVPTLTQEEPLDRLTRVTPAANTKPSIKVEKDSHPQPKQKKQLEKVVHEPQKSPSESKHVTQPVTPARKQGKGLFHWIHRIRSRNKEDPTKQ